LRENGEFTKTIKFWFSNSTPQGCTRDDLENRAFSIARRATTGLRQKMRQMVSIGRHL